MLVLALALTLAVALGMVWAAVGRGFWWVPAFALSFAGGYLNVGFKIYPVEIGIGLSLVALAALLMFHTPRRIGRPALDWSLCALPAYMLLHLAVSCALNLAAGKPGTGTILRLYLNGLWGVGFAALFWTYGSLRHLRIALILATVFCGIRVLNGALVIGVPDPWGGQSDALYVPSTSLDLRLSALLLIALLVIWFYRRREGWIRLAIGSAYVAAIYLVWLGASRVAALSAALTLLFWALVQRRRAGLLAGGVGVLAAVLIAIAVNVSPGFYDSLPNGVQRSMSTFVVTRDLDMHAETAGSNAWHFTLMEAGFRRWTRNPLSFLVGNPVGGWQPDYATLESWEEQADVAAQLALYENAMSTVTATLGLVGLLLWARALHWLYRPFTRTVLRSGIRRPDDALAFVAVQSLVLYLGFSVIAGGYPATQCVLGVLAAMVFNDRRHAERRHLATGERRVLLPGAEAP